MPALSWILDGVCSCLDGGCQISVEKSSGCWRLDYLKRLYFCPTMHVFIDAISTIMAIVLLNLNAKYLFVTFRLAFEFGYFY